MRPLLHELSRSWSRFHCSSIFLAKIAKHCFRRGAYQAFAETASDWGLLQRREWELVVGWMAEPILAPVARFWPRAKRGAEHDCGNMYMAATMAVVVTEGEAGFANFFFCFFCCLFSPAGTSHPPTHPHTHIPNVCRRPGLGMRQSSHGTTRG